MSDFCFEELLHLAPEQILGIHDTIINWDGGMPGIRDGFSAEGVVQRIITKNGYDPFGTIAEVAAFYAYAIARSHIFNDGNKRSAATCMIAFLRGNGYALHANPLRLGKMIRKLAAGRIDYRLLAAWIHPSIARIPFAPLPGRSHSHSRKILRERRLRDAIAVRYALESLVVLGIAYRRYAFRLTNYKPLA